MATAGANAVTTHDLYNGVTINGYSDAVTMNATTGANARATTHDNSHATKGYRVTIATSNIHIANATTGANAPVAAHNDSLATHGNRLTIIFIATTSTDAIMAAHNDRATDDVKHASLYKTVVVLFILGHRHTTIINLIIFRANVMEVAHWNIIAIRFSVNVTTTNRFRDNLIYQTNISLRVFRNSVNHLTLIYFSNSHIQHTYTETETDSYSFTI